MMKKALIAMAAMFLLIVFPCGGLWSLLSHLIGGGTVFQDVDLFDVIG